MAMGNEIKIKIIFQQLELIFFTPIPMKKEALIVHSLLALTSLSPLTALRAGFIAACR
jgi:hypothetical protein